jgi:hypothetical protein
MSSEKSSYFSQTEVSIQYVGVVELSRTCGTGFPACQSEYFDAIRLESLLHRHGKPRITE